MSAASASRGSSAGRAASDAASTIRVAGRDPRAGPERPPLEPRARRSPSTAGARTPRRGATAGARRDPGRRPSTVRRRRARAPRPVAAGDLRGRERAVGRLGPEREHGLVGALPAQRREALDQRPELVLAEQPDDGLAVVVAEPGGLEVELDRQVAHDPHELAALEDPVPGLAGAARAA